MLNHSDFINKASKATIVPISIVHSYGYSKTKDQIFITVMAFFAFIFFACLFLLSFLKKCRHQSIITKNIKQPLLTDNNKKIKPVNGPSESKRERIHADNHLDNNLSYDDNYDYDYHYENINQALAYSSTHNMDDQSTFKKLSRSQKIMSQQPQRLQNNSAHQAINLQPSATQAIPPSVANHKIFEFRNKPGYYFSFHKESLKALKSRLEKPDRDRLEKVIENAKVISGREKKHKSQHGFFINEEKGEIKIKMQGCLRLFGKKDKTLSQKPIYLIDEYSDKHKKREHRKPLFKASK